MNDGTKVWKLRYCGVDIVEGAKDKGFEALHMLFENKNDEIHFSQFCKNEICDTGIVYNMPIAYDADLQKTMRDYESNIVDIERGFKRESSFNTSKLKQYAEYLAGYINCCKDLNKTYSEALKKLNNTKELLQIEMADNEYEKFEETISQISKKSKPNTHIKAIENRCLNPIRDLVKRLKDKQDGILSPLLERKVLKIGVKSSFKPTAELDVHWILYPTNDERNADY